MSPLLTIIRGDAYGQTHGRPPVRFVDEADEWPDLSGATFALTVRERRPIGGPDGDLVLAVSNQSAFEVTTAGGHAVLELSLSGEATGSATPGRGREYDVQARWSGGGVQTIVGPGAACDIVPDQTR